MGKKITEPRVVTVYALASSEDQRIRYIGQTVDVVGRLPSHIRTSRQRPHRRISCWIKKVIRDGFEVVFTVIEENAVWNTSEIRWIAEHRANGFDLVNLTNGGDGNLGYVWSDERRQQHSHILSGKKKSPEHCAAMSKARKGVPLAPNTAAKVSAALKGKRPKNLDDLHAANKGTTRSPELRQRISAALKGRRVTDIEVLRDNFKKASAARGGNSPETRQKIAEALRGKPIVRTDDQWAALAARAKTIMQDPAVRVKVSQSLTGRKLSPESIAKRTATRRANSGYLPSDDTRKKQSAAAQVGWQKRRQKKETTYVE